MTPESQSNGTCSSAIDGGAGEIMLFGVRVKVDPMRKCVSMNDLSQYVQVQPVCNGNTVDAAAVAADSSYASADDSVRQLSNSGRERKRGVPWTEEEHKLFLLGLQKVGKGDWRGISRKYVKTRTPTQVASHAQKYFLRRSNLNRRRRRSSLFDITTDSVAATPLDEQVHEDKSSQFSSYQISPLSGFPVATFPATVSPVPSLPFNYQTETVTVNNGDEINALAGPTPNLPWANQSTMAADNYPNQKQERNLLSLSLNLSLSNDDNRVDPFQAIPSFKNGDGIISVA